MPQDREAHADISDDPHGCWGPRRLALGHHRRLSGAQDAPKPANGKHIFRFDSFGNETFWTDTCACTRRSQVQSIPPRPSRGMKVDADALPPGTPQDR
jgi:hypothetical protein